MKLTSTHHSFSGVAQQATMAFGQGSPQAVINHPVETENLWLKLTILSRNVGRVEMVEVCFCRQGAKKAKDGFLNLLFSQTSILYMLPSP